MSPASIRPREAGAGLADRRLAWSPRFRGEHRVIQTGQVTTYQSAGNHCVINTYTQGQSFIERPGVPLIAIAGSDGALIYATFPGVPVGGSPRIDLPNPGTCPGV